MQTAFTSGMAPDIRGDLEKIVQVSSYLNFSFSLEDIADYFLPARNLTAEKLNSIISNGDFKDLPFEIKDGYLVTGPLQSDMLRKQRERVSAEKLNSAARFALLLRRIVPFIQTVAVTGSVAYGSAEKWDDIDLFIVTQRKRLWLSVLLALVLVRVEKLLRLYPTHLLPFCLSYVHDEQGFADDAARNSVNPLFARELLKAKPVSGPNEYLRILKENTWVSEFYSRPYSATVKALRDGDSSARGGTAPARSMPILDWAEALVYVFLSRYLKLRAYLTNLTLRSRREELRLFEPRITRNSCVYTSNFYKWLHSLWGEP
jgi:hypothetical protein